MNWYSVHLESISNLVWLELKVSVESETSNGGRGLTHHSIIFIISQTLF